MLEFNFSNALMHIARTDAPRGFLPKFALSYLLAAILLGGLSLIVMRPLIELYVGLFTAMGSGALDANDDAAVGQYMLDNMDGLTQTMGLAFLLLLPCTLGIWAVFEASIQRFYVRKDTFRLRLGNDEWRLMAVGLVVYLLLFVVLFISIIPMAIVVGIAGATGSPSIAILGVVIGYIVMLAILFWYIVKVSAASALTIRDEQVRIFESFRVTKGRFWPIFFAFLIIWFGMYILQSTIYGMGIFAVIAQFSELLSGGADPQLEEVMAQLQAPAVLGTMAVFFVLLSLSYGLSMILMGGPGALAALNDPDKPFQGSDPSEVFN